MYPTHITQLTTASGHTYHMGGIAKGSGMIHPNMATMLAVVTCDAPVAPSLWRAMFKRASVNSFNQITVDGDTSTNDCVLGLTSGLAGGPLIEDESSAEAVQLEAGLTALLQALAKSIAWDGEGATCLIEVSCKGAQSQAEANMVAKSVAGSSLVKSAIFGGDPNWGRIAAAAGYMLGGAGGVYMVVCTCVYVHGHLCPCLCMSMFVHVLCALYSIIHNAIVYAPTHTHPPTPTHPHTHTQRYSGVQFDQNEMSVQLGDILLMDKGQPLEFDAKVASGYLRSKTDVHGTVEITVGVGNGPGQGVAWGCDLSYDYVKYVWVCAVWVCASSVCKHVLPTHRINAEYTT